MWRNTLAFTTLFALIGFASFSLMPPRLLDSERRVRPAAGAERRARLRLRRHARHATATFWSFDSETLKDVSNQYAAMPSLHIGWSTWAALVLRADGAAAVGEGARRRSTRSPPCSASW